MPFNQRHLDEDQRLVGHARMKKREQAAIAVQAILEVVPTRNGVDCLIGDQLLEEAAPRRKQSFQTLSSTCSAGLSDRNRITSARMSTKNRMPSGSVLNRRNRSSRGGSSAFQSGDFTAALHVVRSRHAARISATTRSMSGPKRTQGVERNASLSISGADTSKAKRSSPRGHLPTAAGNAPFDHCVQRRRR